MKSVTLATLQRRLLLTSIALLLTLAGGEASPIAEKPQAKRGAFFQTSTIGALGLGLFDAHMTFQELKRHGDFGLGTFHALDGEMVGFDGKFYQIRADGKAQLVPNSATTPFAVVTFFRPDKTLVLERAMDFAQLQEYLDAAIPTPNICYAVKISGTFRSLKTRSVAPQSKPYPTLADAVKKQSVFEFQNLTGTMVGFRTPQYMDGLNVPGYHFHFLTGDRKAGGHLLDCTVRNVKIEIQYLRAFEMTLPDNNAFAQANLSRQQPMGAGVETMK